MTECWRMSTFSRSATSAALRSGRTLKPMTMAPDAAVDDPQLDAIVAQLGQRVGEHLRGALHVGLDDDRQFLHAAFGNLLLQRLQRQASALGAERLVLRLHLAILRDLARLGGVLERLERVAGGGQPAQPEDF